MLVARNDQECRPAVCFEGSHFILVERDRTEHDHPRILQAHHSHAPRQVHERHVDLSDHRENIVVDLRELSVWQDFPLLKRSGHAPPPSRSPARYRAWCASKGWTCSRTREFHLTAGPSGDGWGVIRGAPSSISPHSSRG